jgi:pilus assembly protein CpaB
VRIADWASGSSLALNALRGFAAESSNRFQIMNRRLLTILLCAFCVAAGASYIVYRMIGQEMNGRAKGKIQAVIVAAHDMEIGALIKKEDLKTGQVVGEPPKGYVAKLEAAVGRGVVTRLYQGETIIEGRLAPVGSGAGLAATIPAGMRACAVKVNEVVGVAGFVVPGMRVDVLISGSATNTGAAGTKVKTLLQNIEVLSAGTNYQQDAEGKPVKVEVVNLLVTPEQAELLSLASNETKIQLVLRNPLDRQFSKTPGSEMTSLFGDATTRPVAPAVVRSPALARVEKRETPRPEVFTVQVLNGGKRTDQSFPASGVRQ